MKVAVALSLVMLGGCAFIKPTAEARFNPVTGAVYFFSSRDDSIVVENLTYTDTNGMRAFHVDKVEVQSRSSSVIEANVQQMAQMNEMHKTFGVNATAILTGLSQLTAQMGQLVAAFPQPHVAASGFGVNVEAGTSSNQKKEGTTPAP